LTQQVPGTRFDRLRPQKSTDRLDQKIEDKNDPDTLSDYLGAQVAADSPQAKDALVAALKKNFKVIEVDDEFLTGRKDKAQYPSTNVQVQLSNGVTAEVQIVPQEVQDATEQSHAHYRAGRDAEEKGDTQERDRRWKQAADINQGQLAKFKQRNGIADAPAQMGDYEVMGDPIKIGSHTFLRVKQGGSNGAANDSGSVKDAGAPLPGTGEEQPGRCKPCSAVSTAAAPERRGHHAQRRYASPSSLRRSQHERCARAHRRRSQPRHQSHHGPCRCRELISRVSPKSNCSSSSTSKASRKKPLARRDTNRPHEAPLS
jgi:hypothetical protein